MTKDMAKNTNRKIENYEMFMFLLEHILLKMFHFIVQDSSFYS